MNRIHDIESAQTSHKQFKVWVDGEEVLAKEGENILSVLFSIGKRVISKNDHGIENGAYCSMGICFCCHVNINGQHKQRACKTIVEEGMTILTRDNLYQKGGCLNE